MKADRAWSGRLKIEPTDWKIMQGEWNWKQKCKQLSSGPRWAIQEAEFQVGHDRQDR